MEDGKHDNVIRLTPPAMQEFPDPEGYIDADFALLPQPDETVSCVIGDELVFQFNNPLVLLHADTPQIEKARTMLIKALAFVDAAVRERTT